MPLFPTSSYTPSPHHRFFELSVKIIPEIPVIGKYRIQSSKYKRSDLKPRLTNMICNVWFKQQKLVIH